MKWDSIVAVEYDDESKDEIIKESKVIGEDLQNLVEEWRDSTYPTWSAAKTAGDCASELEAVIGNE